MRRIKPLAYVAWLALASSCHRQAPPDPLADYFKVPSVGLLVPKVPGWMEDPSLVDVDTTDETKSVTVMRLIQQSSVAGSPRVSVVRAPAANGGPTMVEDFLRHNLQEMGTLERNEQIRILHVEQRAVSVGNAPAYRVHHEYTTGGGPSQVAINQVSTFLVVDGHGVAITAAGRAELFHPLADTMETMMAGLRLQKAAPADAPRSTTKTVDLGKIGGKPKP